MIESYAVGVSAKLYDEITPSLLRIIETAGKANTALLEFAASARKASGAGGSLARAMAKAAEASAAMGDSAGALARASYVLDTMAASSADLARNMEAARAAGVGMGRGPGGVGGAPSQGDDGQAKPRRRMSHAAIATGGFLAYGIYENAKLLNIINRAVVTDGTAPGQQSAAESEYMRRIRAAALKYGFAANGLPDFAESYLSASRLLRGMSASKRMSIVDTILPYAAEEASTKNISLDESMRAFIGASHMAGAYDEKSIQHILPALINTSLSTNSSMRQIENAAGYAVPILRTGLGIEPSKVFTMIAMMQRAGITNTKSGTWIADLFMNAVPKNFGGGLFHSSNQIKALKELGLMDGKSHLTYLDSKGGLDPLKLLDIVARHAATLTPIERAAASKQAFGTQGARALSIFTDTKMMAMLPALEGAMKGLENPRTLLKERMTDNPAMQEKQGATNLALTATGVTATFMGPVNAALKGSASFFSMTATAADRHPVLGGAMDVAGIYAGWKIGGALYRGFDRRVVSISKATARGIGSVIERAMVAITGEEVGVAALAALGGTVAVGAAVIGALGYVLKRAFDTGLRNFNPSPSQHPFWVGPMGEVMTDDTMPKATAGHAAPNYHFTVTLDGHEIAAKVTHRIAPAKSTGSTGFNPAAALYGPGMAIGNQ